jgi:hypothetical protein
LNHRHIFASRQAFWPDAISFLPQLLLKRTYTMNAPHLTRLVLALALGATSAASALAATETLSFNGLAGINKQQVASITGTSWGDITLSASTEGRKSATLSLGSQGQLGVVSKTGALASLDTSDSITFSFDHAVTLMSWVVIDDNTRNRDNKFKLDVFNGSKKSSDEWSFQAPTSRFNGLTGSTFTFKADGSDAFFLKSLTFSVAGMSPPSVPSIPSAVPEAGSSALALAGLATALMLSRRRARR